MCVCVCEVENIKKYGRSMYHETLRCWVYGCENYVAKSKDEEVLEEKVETRTCLRGSCCCIFVSLMLLGA